MHRIFASGFLAGFCLLGWSGPAAAQVPLEVFENPVNLQVLPHDISPEDLRVIMTSFPREVGLRCSRCHVRDPDKPITEWDFASDEQERKQIARKMLRMVARINETIGSLDRGPDHKPIEVKCVTCHRRVSQPRMIEDIMAEAIAEGGVEAAEAKYRELRDIYGDGGFAYDFSGFHLGEIADGLAGQGDVDGAMRLHRLNFELNPDDGLTYLMRANTLETLGQLTEALTDMEVALEKDPTMGNFLPSRIEELKARIEEGES